MATYRLGAPFLWKRRTYRAGEEIEFPDPPATHMVPLDREARIAKYHALRPQVKKRPDGRRVAHHVKLDQISRSIGYKNPKSLAECVAHIDAWMAAVEAEMRTPA